MKDKYVFDRFDWVVSSQLIVTLYIYREGRSCPLWSRNPNKSGAKIQLQLRLYSPKPVWPPLWTRLTNLPRVQNFPKQYLSHPKSKLDVVHINLDQLDENYLMVKSILHSEQVDQTSLTDLWERSDRSSQSCHFWVWTNTPYFMAKLVCHKTFSMVKISQKRW